MQTILEKFEITNRGFAIIISDASDLPAGTELVATVYRPDGSTSSYVAFKEWVLRRRTAITEDEAFLLQGASDLDVPSGSKVGICLRSP